MSRYIDADAMLEYLDLMYDKQDDWIEPYNTGVLGTIYYIKHKAPSIDIVRCKECKHWTGETEYYEDREYKACWQLCGQYVNSEFWCKYGEREGE